MPATLFIGDFRSSALTSARTGAIPVGLPSYCYTKDDKGGDAHRSFLKFKDHSFNNCNNLVHSTGSFLNNREDNSLGGII